MQKKSNVVSVICFQLLTLILLIVCQSLSLNFYVTSTLLILYAIGSFFISFERRKLEAREIVVLAVLCAIATAGRVIFQVIPFVSFLVGFVIITGVSFGPHAGFFCGAMSALLSNFSCGQGPWTPWQMFAFGLAGYIAGAMYFKKKDKPNKKVLTMVSFIIVFMIVGPILDVSAMFVIDAEMIFDLSEYKLLLASGLIANLIHALSVSFCIYFLADPMFEKLDRIRLKYGMVDTHEI